MFPNFDQLLIVCGISLVIVALIVWIVIKIPSEEKEDKDNWE